jgi:ribokinase
LNDIKTPNVLVLGGINMGLITKAARAPGPGETLRGERFYTSPGGKGATQAVAAARMGANVRMVGRVGNDLFGPVLLDALRSNGVDVQGVAVDPDHASGAGVIVVDDTGQNRVLATYGANLQCDETQLAQVEASLDWADVLMLQMEIPFEVSLAAAALARNRDVLVLHDPAPPSQISLDAYADIDIITPNQAEAEFHTGVEVDDPDSAKRAAEIFRSRGVRVAIVKIGDHGVYYSSNNDSGFIPAFSVEAVDTTSAGDAFGGALAVALAEGRSLNDAVRFGAAAGALAVTRPGVQDSIPSRSEVEDLLTRQGN